MYLLGLMCVILLYKGMDYTKKWIPLPSCPSCVMRSLSNTLVARVTNCDYCRAADQVRIGCSALGFEGRGRLVNQGDWSHSPRGFPQLCRAMPFFWGAERHPLRRSAPVPTRCLCKMKRFITLSTSRGTRTMLKSAVTFTRSIRRSLFHVTGQGWRDFHRLPSQRQALVI